MVDIKEYKCSNCGGIILFDIATQMAKCQSCGAVFGYGAFAEYRHGVEAGVGDDDTFDCAAASGGYQHGSGGGVVGDDDTFDCAAASGEYRQGTGDGALGGEEDTFDCVAASGDALGDEDTFECAAWVPEGGGAVWEDPESDDLTTGACPSCGAELYGGKTTVSMICPCCGNAQIVAKRIQGLLKPDSIIPFKLDKNTAVEALTEFCNKRKRLLPNRFISEKRLDSIQGVYAPFWLFDAEVDGSFEYEATKKEGSGKSSTTHYYYVAREGDVAFRNIPVDASVKMDDDYMDAIEPFNYSQIRDFHPSYLAGYVAEKYDVDIQKSSKRAEYRIENTVERLFRKTVSGYNSVTLVDSEINVKNGSVSYSLLPVWIVNTTYDGDEYLFMMNGQTGKLVGRLPVDDGKAWMYRGALTGIICALLSPILYYLKMWGVLKFLTIVIIGIALTIIGLKDEVGNLDIDPPLPIVVIISVILSAWSGFWIVRKWINDMDTAKEQTGASDYVVPGSFKIRVDIDDRIR